MRQWKSIATLGWPDGLTDWKDVQKQGHTGRTEGRTGELEWMEKQNKLTNGLDGQRGATNRRNGRKNRLDGQTDGWTDRCKDGQEWIDQQTDLPTGRTDGWTGWTDRQMDAWNEETRKGQKDR